MTQSENSHLQFMLQFEKKLWDRGIRLVAGIDEAGRGPLAGPVVAAAVIFPQDIALADIDDSKKLTEVKREGLFNQIATHALAVGVGVLSEKEIDCINILQASLKAMHLAVEKLKLQPDHLLIDGNQTLRNWLGNQTAIVKGDQKSLSIAAASIIAKVTRDRMMVAYDKQYPQYGFAKHKGYGTKAHVQAIQKYGRCPIHRNSFHVRGLDDR